MVGDVVVDMDDTISRTSTSSTRSTVLDSSPLEIGAGDGQLFRVNPLTYLQSTQLPLSAPVAVSLAPPDDLYAYQRVYGVDDSDQGQTTIEMGTEPFSQPPTDDPGLENVQVVAPADVDKSSTESSSLTYVSDVTALGIAAGMIIPRKPAVTTPFDDANVATT